MPNDINYDLQVGGDLVRRSHLRALGHGRRRIEAAIADGTILRICGDWVATRRASRTAVIAILQRGKLTVRTNSSSRVSRALCVLADYRAPGFRTRFHDPVADRKRNATLVRLGYRVHRFGYEQVVNGWDDVEATIRELLRYPPR